MTWLTRIGLDASRVTVLFMALTLAVGTSSYLGFPKREDPEILIRTAVVSALNAGLTLSQLEELVALPMEETARAIPGVDAVRTQLIGGAAILQVDLADNVPEEDLKRVFDEIRDDMDGIARSLPANTLGPLVNSDFGDVSIATIAITGEGFSHSEVVTRAKTLRDRLYALDPVSAVTLHGVHDEVVTLEIDRARLASTGIIIDPLLAALAGQNVRETAGSIVSGSARLPLDVSGDLRSIEEIEALLVEIPDVGLLRLADIVTVTRGLEEPADAPVLLDHQQAVVLAVEMAEGEDVTQVGRVLRATIDAWVADQPLGVEATLSTFQPDVVSASVSGALINMAQTFVVVLFVMTVFLGLRTALVVSSIVPFAVSFAFAFMGPFGVELQQVSIAAIIISLGLLVDNGVVVIEDMRRRVVEGATRRDAALGAGAQYAVPLAIASVTTVSAFLPLFLLEGTEGQYGYSLGVVVMLMLAGSFLSALYFLPRLAAWALPEFQPNATPRLGLMDRAADGYATIVSRVVRLPWLFVTAVIACVAFGISFMPAVPQQMFPPSDRAQILAYLDMPRGTDIAETEAVTLALADWLRSDANPEVTDVTSYVGSGGPRFVLAIDPADADPASAFMVINTTNFEAGSDVLARARAHVLSAFPVAQIRIKRLSMGGREPSVDVEISGPDAHVLLDAAYEVEAMFATAPGLTQNRNDWGAPRLAGTVAIAQDRIREYGISSSDVAGAMDAFFDGAQVSTFRDGDALIPIVLRGAPGDRIDLSSLRNTAIEANGQIVALDQISTLRPRLEFSTIRREDQVRKITISAISSAMTAQALYAHVAEPLDALAARLGPAYEVTIGGEIENSARVRALLGGGFPAALAVMVAALMIQFNSFRRVAITLASIPLVVAGVGPALLAAGQPLSFFGILGMIALSGIIVNNAIVLIDQIEIERRSLELNEAIVEATRKRFRPILLTSMTTVLGLLPMALDGGALWEPMATLMMGGLAGAACLALFWVPALYRMSFRRAA